MLIVLKTRTCIIQTPKFSSSYQNDKFRTISVLSLTSNDKMFEGLASFFLKGNLFIGAKNP